MEEIKGLIFDIKKYSIHDGPGIRTTVFFKGCPLRCQWCHNPEALHFGPELVLFDGKCINCGECVRVCARQAHERRPDGSRVYRREECVSCGRCAELCYAEALVMEGKRLGVEEVMAELRKDQPFYENSDGGVTLSGGEPLLQHEFALALLEQCQAEGLHTSLDTSGQAPWRVFEKVLPYVDLFLYDLKHIDEGQHKTYTGVSNRQILENLERIGAYRIPIEIRMPIIPGINDAEAHILGAAEFLSDIDGITQVELFPYHCLGEPKYARLGRDYQLRGLESPDKARLEEIAAWMRPFGLTVHVNG
jgi:pyruvate formate lyase activating enzyme